MPIEDDPSKHVDSKKPNHLINEKSPYLQQHAFNPVDWYPWGPEAFEKAKVADKPIFLSIGYSTCHWCHVMAHESFEDPEVAHVLNDCFVSIKVDREERPDIDAVYMTACQTMTGGGGWPLTIIMTPDKQPFFAGTYLPRETRGGLIGLLHLAKRVNDLWTTQRKEVLASAGKLVNMLQESVPKSSHNIVGEPILQGAFGELVEQFDGHAGGFGSAPKFPTPHHLTFLLRYWRRSGDTFALTMVEQTLQAMRRGGVFDQVGFGFHRYSTDDHWFVPHFEKMLYDQALLAQAYLEAFQATKNREYALTASEVFAYVLHDLISPEGLFYSAEDADSEGVEGKFYVWTAAEVQNILPPDLAKIAIHAWGIVKDGNFKEEATGAPTKRNILHLDKPLAPIARNLNLREDDLRTRLDDARRLLLETRSKRVRPHRDEKILTDWNGLMIVALARGAWVLQNLEYQDAAKKAANFLLKKMKTPDGRLMHRYKDGQVDIGGFLDDYAFLAWGLFELFEATFEIQYLRVAIELSRAMLAHFWDDKSGAFYFTADDAESLIVRQQESYDGAIPSGNAVAALVLIYLARILNEPALEEKAIRIVEAFGESVQQHPTGYTQLLQAVDYLVGPSYEIIIAGKEPEIKTREMLHEVRSRFLPNAVLVFRPTNKKSPSIDQYAPFYQYQIAVEGHATTYVCLNHTCKQPATTIEQLREQLDSALKFPEKK